MRFGTYDAIKDEKSLMLLATTTDRMVIHFAHKDFKRCAIMDTHLEVDLKLIVDLEQETPPDPICKD